MVKISKRFKSNHISDDPVNPVVTQSRKEFSIRKRLHIEDDINPIDEMDSDVSSNLTLEELDEMEHVRPIIVDRD